MKDKINQVLSQWLPLLKVFVKTSAFYWERELLHVHKKITILAEQANSKHGLPFASSEAHRVLDYGEQQVVQVEWCR